MQIKNHNRTGFTYIELAIVTLVMAIFAATAAPSYLTALDHYQTEMAAMRIAADLQFARSEALRSSQSRPVHFESGLDRYTLVNISDLNDGNKGYYVNLQEAPFFADLISADFPGNATFEKVEFDRFGRPDSRGTFVVRSGSQVRTVELHADGTVEIVP